MQEPLVEPPVVPMRQSVPVKTQTLQPGGRTARRLRLWLTARWVDDSLMSRTAAHVAIILLVALAISLSHTTLFLHSLTSPTRALYRLNTEQDSAIAGSPQGNESDQAADSPSSIGVPSPLQLAASPRSNSNTLVRAAVPHTIIPERPRDEISHYTVQSGDTIFGIAAEFGLAPETVMWANGRFVEDNPDLLRVGQELIILPLDGVYHQVGSTDTLEEIAAAYSVETQVIIDYPLNNLDAANQQISEGQWLIVPGGTKPYVPRTVVAYSGPIPEEANKGTGIFGWPTAGQITQGFWDRHRALDIGSWEGAPVVAADSGYVVAAGWDDSGYGRMVVIDHGNGFQTLYAHMQVYYVEAGDSVAKGEQIGEVGSTGNSTGPHLHFEIRQSGNQRNPFGFLP
jgi:murein DD-endopeptidase MepM/ murein hydrolase activator NlpD